MGTAGMLLSDGCDALLIDPFATRPGLHKVVLGLPVSPDAAAISRLFASIKHEPVRAVLVTHSHYDHSMDAPFFAVLFRCPLYGSESTANVARGSGMEGDLIRTISHGNKLRFGLFQVTIIESVHGPALFGRIPYPGDIKLPLVPPVPVSKYRLGSTFSLLVEHPRGSAVVHASAGFREGMFDNIKADVLLLGIGGRGDTERYLDAVVRPLGKPVIIPIHWDHFFIPLEWPFRPLIGVRMDEFHRTAERLFPGKIRTLTPLEEKKLF